MRRFIEGFVFFTFVSWNCSGFATEETLTLVLTSWGSPGDNTYETICTWMGHTVTRKVYHEYNIPTGENSNQGSFSDIYRYLGLELAPDRSDLQHPSSVLFHLQHNGWTILSDKQEDLSEDSLSLSIERRTVQLKPPSELDLSSWVPPSDVRVDPTLELEEISSIEGEPKKREVRFHPRSGELAYLQGGPKSELVICQLADGGRPRLNLSSGRAYAFDPHSDRVAVAGEGIHPVFHSLKSGASDRPPISDPNPSSHCSPECMAFSPDGKTIAVGLSEFNECEGTSIRLLDTSTYAEIWRLDRPEARGVTAIQFNPAGNSLTAAFAAAPEEGRYEVMVEGRDEVLILDLTSGSVIHSVTGHWDLTDYFRGVHSIAYSRNGAFLATGGGDFLIQIAHPKTGEILAELNDSGPLRTGNVVLAMDFSPDGRLLACAGTDTCVALWDTESWQMIRRVDMGSVVNSVSFSPDGALLPAACETGVKVWKVGDVKLE